MLMLRPLFCGLLALFCWTLQAASGQTAEIVVGRPVHITIQGVPTEEAQRVTASYVVASDGTINMPYIGPVRASGLSTSSLASAIEAAYRNKGIFTTPTIQVVSGELGKNLAESVVTVGGSVRQPGAVKFVPGLTLYQAIANRGGANEFGAMRRVKVHRAGTLRVYDCTKPAGQNFPLNPDDTIEVPEKTPFGT
jgi:protein involved in polysaccharide export with SLBB domain